MKRKPPSISQFFVKKTKESNTLPILSKIENENCLLNLELAESEKTDNVKSKTDISYFLNSIETHSLTDNDKYIILDELKNPDGKFIFPQTICGGNSRRKCSISWLNRHSWLIYSTTNDSLFCKTCITFLNSDVGKGRHQNKGNLATNGYRNWKKATEDFAIHETLDYHIKSMTFAENFLKVQKGEKISIANVLQTKRQEEIQKNRTYLSSIIDTIIFCGRQGIALRGNGDYGRVQEEEPGFNDGNFRALLRFKIKSGDLPLKEHLDNAAGNALYTSSTIQNQIINICGEIILKKLVENINKSKCFSILMDETTDSSTKEQMTLCVRYVEEETYKINEVFLQFLEIDDLTGKGLAQKLEESLIKVGCNMENLRGQGYDGASAMSGILNGVKTIILKKYPLAYYTHCSSHNLNLVLKDACGISEIRDCFGIIKEVISFFSHSALRTSKLKVIIERMDSSANKKKKLIKLCETRWVERHTSVLRFIDLLIPILEALQSIHETSTDNTTKYKATSLTKSLKKCKFIISLCCVTTLFEITHPVSEALQCAEVDLNYCYDTIQNIISVVKSMRENSIEEFAKIFRDTKKFSEKLDFEIHIPRICASQKHRENYANTDAESYYRQSIFLPFVDFFIQSLESRFDLHASSICSLFSLLPKYSTVIEFEHLKCIMDNYEEILDCSSSQLKAEFCVWKQKWLSTDKSEFPKSAIETLSKCPKQFFPKIYECLKILCTLPVTTATSERSFSTLKRLKSYIRTSTREDRLNGLALLNIHREIEIDAHMVLDIFARETHRISLAL